MDTSQIGNRAWSFAHVLRDDGLSYQAYIEQITYLLFLKMADELTRPPYNQEAIVPAPYDWPNLRSRDGVDLEAHYRRTLEELGKQSGMHDRKPTWSEKKNPDGRWRCYDCEDLLKRDKVSLDLFWLRDESLEDGNNLPEPDLLAAEIADDLQAALEQFNLIALTCYPVHLTFRRSRKGWQGYMVEPLFLFPLQEDPNNRYSPPALEQEFPQINFKAFQSISGVGPQEIMEQAHQLMEELGLAEATAELPDFDEVAARLRTIRPEWEWREEPDPHKLCSSPSLAEADLSGIYSGLCGILPSFINQPANCLMHRRYSLNVLGPMSALLLGGRVISVCRASCIGKADKSSQSFTLARFRTRRALATDLTA